MNIGSLTRTPAFQHASTFAKNGLLTDASIAERQAELNDTGYVADLRKRAVLAAVGNDPTVEHICSFVNPARSGIWNTDGTLNQKRLKELKDRCVKVEGGTLLITRSIFQAFIEEGRAIQNQSGLPNAWEFGNLTWVSPLRFCPVKIPVPYTAVTDGSVDAFFQAYSDRELNGEKAVQWEKVSKFYDPENSSQLRDKDNI